MSMRYPYLLISSFLLVTCSSCSKKVKEDSVVSERYIHKYGYAVSKDEFQKGKYPGQVVTMLKDGVIVTHTYEDGLLHGPSTRTFPDSSTVESYTLYNQGNAVEEVTYTINGIPLKRQVQLSPTRHSITKWYAKGTPLSTEEYGSQELISGQYYTPQHEVESQIEKGSGVRIIRDTQGLLLSKEEVEGGQVIKKELFYSSGTPESISYYKDGELHGEKRTFTESGEPVSTKEYVHNKLHGKTTFYKNGDRFVEIHYLDGMKNGLEIHYLDGETISQEVLWENDKKHGPSKYYVDGIAQVEYFYDGVAVTEQQWNDCNRLDSIITQIDTQASW